MQNRPFSLAPTTIANAVGNILNPPATTGGVGVAALNCYILMKHIRIVNRTGGAVAASLFIGLTGVGTAGTEFAFTATPIPANSALDWNGQQRLDVANFLTGLAGSANALTIEIDGEIGLV